nr:hypothetical protein [Tanacetum cinerariifolium]
MTGQDKEEEEDALNDILKIVVEECKSIYKKAQIRTPSNRFSEIQGIYVMADVGAGINMMPKSLFEYLKLANLEKTNMAIKMVIDTLEEPDETILLGRLFLATIHAQIDVFKGEISLGVGNEKESEYFNPREIGNDDSPALEQRTFHYSKESIDTIDSSSDSQENEVRSHLSENVSRWHVCKPVHITFKVCEEDCRIWHTCNPDLHFCSGYDAIYGKQENEVLKQWICFRDHERQNIRGNGIKFDDFLKVRTTKYTDPYDHHHKSDSPPNDTLHINTCFPDVSKTQPKKSRIRENSFEEWMEIKTNDDPYSRNFDVYKDEFDKEIEQLWYDEGFEEEELWQNGIEEIKYTPPLAKMKLLKSIVTHSKMGKVSKA